LSGEDRSCIQVSLDQRRPHRFNVALMSRGVHRTVEEDPMSTRLSTPSGGPGIAAVIARVVVGGMMFFHGLDKLNSGVSGFGEGLTGMGVPLPSVAAWAVTLLELVGGLMLVVGLLARLIAALMTLELIGAIVVATGANGLIGQDGVGYERDLAYIVGFLVVVLSGPGRPSLDHMLGIERAPAVQATA